MAQEINGMVPNGETYDIFLCTRELPDELTAETAALRQLCAALIGSGYRVFFPPSNLRGLETEARARAIADAVKGSPVMIAAAVGDEGVQDPAARYLWDRFLTLAGEAPGRTFLACCRDVTALPAELEGREILDMGELEFLVKLKEKLSAALPGVLRAPEEEPPAEPAPETPEEEPIPEAPEEEPVPEAPEEASPSEEAPLPRRRRWPWIALAVGAVVILGLIIALCVKLK